MSTWTMAWGEGADDVGAPLPPSDWSPQPVPSGGVQVVRVQIHGFHGLPAEPLLVAWDNERAVVRLPDGQLRWYADGSRQAYERHGEIVVEDVGDHALPWGNRYPAALAVRSLEDLIETVNAEEVTSIDDDGTIHIHGEHDHSRGEAVRAQGTGIILRARGVEGARPWTLETAAARLVDAAHALLEPVDVEVPPEVD